MHMQFADFGILGYVFLSLVKAQRKEKFKKTLDF